MSSGWGRGGPKNSCPQIETYLRCTGRAWTISSL